MMRFSIDSTVPQSFELVSQNFSEDLFKALAPVFPPSKLLYFDGDRVGGLVKIRLGLGAFSKVWVSKIVSREANEDKVQFVDVGEELPPPLRNWKHTHIIKRQADGTTLILDNIEFNTGMRLLDYLLFPVMVVMFSMRTAAYRKYYKALADR